MPSVTVAHFHQLWAELHRRPLLYPPSSILHPRTEQIWLRHFALRIRCSGCRRHWLEVIAKDPPPFSSRISDPVSRIAYFTWTVRVHNAINARLGKPSMKLKEAQRLWNFIPARARDRAHDRSSPPSSGRVTRQRFYAV